MTYTEYVTFNGKKYVSLSAIEKIKARLEKRKEVFKLNSVVTKSKSKYQMYKDYENAYNEVLKVIDQAIKGDNE